MDTKTMDDLQKKLEEQKASLKKELESFATEDKNLKHNWDAKYPNREDKDKDEEADEVQEYENALSLEHSLELKLKNVVEALEKIKQNKYGACEKCGKEIEAERLQAAPEARLCMRCNNGK